MQLEIEKGEQLADCSSLNAKKRYQINKHKDDKLDIFFILVL